MTSQKSGTVEATQAVRDYWEQASCGTTVTTAPKHSRTYFEKIEEHRYEHEPCIHTFAQFTRWSGKKVLEVGVGAGTDFLQFARAGARVYGVDLTQEAVDNVRERLKLYGLRAERLECRNAEHLPFESDSFDLVYSWGVIHHAADMEKVFSEIYRVTRPGGHVKIMVYNFTSLMVLYLYLRHAVLTGKLHRGPRWALWNHLESFGTKAYTKGQIEELLRHYPHQNLQFRYWNPIPHKGAPLERIRRIAHILAPRRTRWFLAFEFDKSVA